MAPGEAERRLLGEMFGFHPLSVDDAVSALQFPKIETYPGYLYVVLHGIDANRSTPSLRPATSTSFSAATIW